MKKIISLFLSLVLISSLMIGCTPAKDQVTGDENVGEENVVKDENEEKENIEMKISTGEGAPEYCEALTTDVLVLGGGGAGITSALTASENGSKVILAEKIGYLGGATIISGGIVPAADTRQQQEAGIVDNNDLFARDIFRPNLF